MFTRIKNYFNRKKNVRRTVGHNSSIRNVLPNVESDTIQSITESITDLFDNDNPPPSKKSHHTSCHSVHDSHDSGGYDCGDSGGSSDCGGGSDGGGGGCGCD